MVVISVFSGSFFKRVCELLFGGGGGGGGGLTRDNLRRVRSDMKVGAGSSYSYTCASPVPDHSLPRHCRRQQRRKQKSLQKNVSVVLSDIGDGKRNPSKGEIQELLVRSDALLSNLAPPWTSPCSVPKPRPSFRFVFDCNLFPLPLKF